MTRVPCSKRVPVATGGPSETLRMLALAGQKFFYSLAAIQLAMVFLVAPVSAAGAICYDRRRISRSSP